jgi:hypothetical protein
MKMQQSSNHLAARKLYPIDVHPGLPSSKTIVATIVARNYNCILYAASTKIALMSPQNLRIDRAAEKGLRSVIAKEFRKMATTYGSEQAAAKALGVSRQRFKKYLDMKMTPKADVLLVAMAKWPVDITHEGIRFKAVLSRKKAKPAPAGQLTLDYFDQPQVLQDDQKNVEIRVSRKQSDTLKFAVEVRLAG